MWVDHEKLLSLIPHRTLFRMISERRVESRPNGISPNGKPIREVNIFSLPLELQAKALHLVDGQPAGVAPEEHCPDLSHVPEHHIELALVRIAACREALAAPRGEKAAYTAEAASKVGITPQQLYRDLARYKRALKSGKNLLEAMLPKWRGPGRPKALPSDLEAKVQAEFLKPTRPAIAKVHRALVKECEKRGIPAPGYATIRRIVAEIPEAARVRHRRGKEAWRKTSMPKVNRDYTTLAPLELLSGDHHPVDLFVLHEGKALRPWITTWMDLRTRVILGRAYSFQPNSWVIARALRHAILPKPPPEADPPGGLAPWPMCGVPRGIYVDNGKDYRSRHLEGKGKTFRFDLNTQTKGVLAELGVGVEWAVDPNEAPLGGKKRNVHSRAYSPWSKTVERWFGTFERDFMQGLVGWCGRSPAERPEKLAGELKRGKLMTFEEFCREADRWIVEEYHQRPHHGQGMGGKSPAETWDGLEKEIRLPRERTLDLLLMKVEGRTVHPSGIRLNNYFYWNEKLALHVGERVDVRYSSEEAGRILVFRGTDFLCEATEARLYGFDASAGDLKEIAARQRRAERLTLEYREMLEEKAAEPDEVARHFKKAAGQARLERAATERQKAHEKHVTLITQLEKAASEIKKPKKSRLAAWPHELKKAEGA